MATDLSLQALFSKVKQEVKIFSNMVCILGKVESDGFFERLSVMFEGIVESEMLYAVIGKPDSRWCY